MERNIIQQPSLISRQDALEILKQEPRWILINDQDHRITSLLPATDLARYLNELEEVEDHNQVQELNLLRIPAKRLDTAATTIIATLQEAYERMQSEHCNVLFIRGAHGESKHRIYGVITREHIESSYRV